MNDVNTKGIAGRAQGVWRTLVRIVQDAGTWRLIVTAALLLVALGVARFSWEVKSLPFLTNAERSYYDRRAYAFAPRVDQDKRIVMVVFNDQTLINTRKRSPLDRATLARALTSIDAMGAKAIGIDILIDQAQDEDPQLLSTFRAMKTPTYLAYADIARNGDNITYTQQQFLDGFMGQLKGSNVHPASVRFVVDPDGVMRSWPRPEKGLPLLLTKAMFRGAPEFADYEGAIRYKLPKMEEGTDSRTVIASFPVDLFTDPAVAGAFAEQVRGKYVLIGGDIVDTDVFPIPATAQTGKTMIGLEVHAHMLAQMLDRARQPHMMPWALSLLALLVVVAAVFTSLLDLRWWQFAILGLVQLALFGGLPLWLQAQGTDTLGLPAIGWAIGWGLAFAATGSAARAVGSQQRKFAQGALGKYLPRDIANQILQEPELLALHGERRQIFCLFTDLEGFTKLSHALSPEMVATLLNRYLDMLSDVVLDHGGTIDKFVGDAVVAFWGAPISRPDDGANAAKAAYAMWQAGEEFRRTVPPGTPPVGKTRVGLHWGEAIVGNFGGEGRIQYTAFGDSMNTASRLESANKPLKSGVMASREAKERSGLDWWRPMGSVVLRGRATPVEIFEPAPDFPVSDARHLQTILGRLDTNRSDAIVEMKALVARYPGDEALQNLLYRTERSEGGEAYVLD